MPFRNPSKRQTSLSLNINGRQNEEWKTINFLGITKTSHLNWNEHCKYIATRANKRIFQLWRLSNLNVEQESLLLLYKSWIRPFFLYANTCWLKQSQTVVSIMQKAQNRALRICLRTPRWYSVQKSHEESNSPTIRNIKIRLEKDYIKRAQKNKIEAILRLTEKKQCLKNNCKSTLDLLIGSATWESNLFMWFTDLTIRDYRLRPKRSFGSKSGSNLVSGGFFDPFESEFAGRFLGFKTRFWRFQAL